MMQRIANACLTGLAVWLIAAPGAAKDFKRDTGGCRDAVTSELRRRFPQSGNVQFSEDRVSRDPHSAEMKGRGQFEDHSGDWVKFSYTCTYNPRNNEPYAVDVDTKRKEYGGGHGDHEYGDRAQQHDDFWRDGHRDGAAPSAVSACESAARNRIQNKHPHARNLRFSNPDTSEPSRGEVGVNGGGRFKGSNGEPFEFSYECTYNSANGKVHAVRVTGM